MIPWEELDRTTIPGGSDPLRLVRRGSEYAIRLGTTELMNSRAGGSEEALARLALARLGPRPAPRVLVGGLGLGFTLRAALALLPERASVTVAELVPAVVDWAHGPLAPLHGASLADPRVTIAVADVADLMTAGGPAWDAILLDVDNGPDGLTAASNDALYGHAGLARALSALSRGGVLAVWSSGRDDGFTRRLRQAGYEVEIASPQARGRRGGGRHVVWLATRPGAPSERPRRS